MIVFSENRLVLQRSGIRNTLTYRPLCFSDVNDFISQSGWFSQPGLAHGKAALQHVVAKKAGMAYDTFTTMKLAVYLFNYRHGEKVYCIILRYMNLWVGL